MQWAQIPGQLDFCYVHVHRGYIVLFQLRFHADVLVLRLAGPRIQAASNSLLSYELWCTICVYQHLHLHLRKTATLCTCIGASFDRRYFVEGRVGVRAVSAVLSRDRFELNSDCLRFVL